MKIRYTKEKCKILKNIVESLFKTAFSNSFNNVFEWLEKSFLKFSYFENTVKNNIVTIPDRVIISFQDESIRFGNNWIFWTLFIQLTTFQDLQDKQSVICGISHQIDEILQTILDFTHSKCKRNNNHSYSLVKQGIFDYLQTMKRHVIALYVVKTSLSHNLQIFFDLPQ